MTERSTNCEVIDRGGLNEFIDLSAPIGSDPDAYREVWHYLQHECYNRITVDGSSAVVTGVTKTGVGQHGGMWFQNRYTFYEGRPFFQLEVTREYLHSFPLVADGSVCFLSPGGFARRFFCHSPHPCGYWRRPDFEGYLPDPTAAGRDNPDECCNIVPEWEECTSNGGPLSSVIPIRVRMTGTKECWGAILNDSGVGFFLSVVRYSGIDRNLGELRVTRPRPPAEKKFDEVEFQWAPGAQRSKGHRETGIFLVGVVPSGGNLEDVPLASVGPGK